MTNTSQEIDAWVAAVLRRAGVNVRTFDSGNVLGLFNVPAKWAAIVDALTAGLHALARGETLPAIAPKETR